MIENRALHTTIKIINITRVIGDCLAIFIYSFLTLGAFLINYNQGSIIGCFGIVIVALLFFSYVSDSFSYMIGGSNNKLLRLLKIKSKEDQISFDNKYMLSRMEKAIKLSSIKNNQDNFNAFNDYIKELKNLTINK